VVDAAAKKYEFNKALVEVKDERRKEASGCPRRNLNASDSFVGRKNAKELVNGKGEKKADRGKKRRASQGRLQSFAAVRFSERASSQDLMTGRYEDERRREEKEGENARRAGVPGTSNEISDATPKPDLWKYTPPNETG